ncbi:hypothetical protein HZY97_08415 [Sphingomonas sp. R-74633]|uniref:hypothetical protein n=1 Tax=Sphingomonas sp. R-74633 TaxID=2751188 RepID=UPI0015D1DE12|nr:hypothetical protein [Sphingomonas sp. R-74633]NYT40776.1 hypothetical protein [Sphingomonas sp. R-74633]
MIVWSQTIPPAPAASDEAAQTVPFPASDGAKGGEEGKGERASPSLPPSPVSTSPAAKSVSPSATSARERDDVYNPAPHQNPVVAALQEEGLYLPGLGAGKHSLICPWAQEHGSDDPGPAIYTEPTTMRPIGKFFCPYPHTERVQIDRLLERLGIEAAHARCKPSIRLVSGEMLRVLDAAERSLLRLDTFYQSGGVIVTVNATAKGDAAVSLVNDNVLTKALARVADWEKFDGRSKEWKPSDPPTQIVRQLLNAQTYDHLPVLDGVARQPYFRKADDTLVAEPGYDAQSKVYAVFDREAFVVSDVSEAAARDALGALKDLISEFHFASECDRSAALCAMLTAAVRSSLPLAPAFNISASTPGSGKSYLGALITPFAGPGEPLNMSYPTTAKEASKSMLAALLGKPAVISFDDMQTDWLPFGMINRMLTSETVTDRVLGVSRTVTAATNVFVMGTGNNVSPVRDMSRRVVTIQLRPPTGSPATLSYAGRPVDAVRANRGRFVSLALTIVQAWQAAGRPRTDVPDIASFGAWSDKVRQPLLWLGEPDPATSLIQQVRSDPDAESLARFMEAWRLAFGSKPMTLRKVVDRAERDNGALLDAMMELPFVERGAINRNKLGWYLKRNANRIVDGLHFQREDNSERTAWSVQTIGDSYSGVSVGNASSARTEAPIDPREPVMINGEIY